MAGTCASWCRMNARCMALFKRSVSFSLSFSLFLNLLPRRASLILLYRRQNVVRDSILPYKNCTFNAKTRRFISRRGYRSRASRNLQLPRGWNAVSIDRSSFSPYLPCSKLYPRRLDTRALCRLRNTVAKRSFQSILILSLYSGMMDLTPSSLFYIYVSIYLFLLEFRDIQLRSLPLDERRRNIIPSCNAMRSSRAALIDAPRRYNVRVRSVFAERRRDERRGFTKNRMI